MNDTERLVAGATLAADSQTPVQYLLAPPWVRHDAAPVMPAGTLEDFIDQGVLRIRCRDRITLSPKPDSPAQLVRRMDFTNWAADNVRHRIANDGASKVAKQLLQELLATWPRAVETAPPSFEENAGTNQLAMRCAYEIREPWAQADERGRRTLSLVDTVTNKELAPLQVARRQSPILLGRPRRVSWRATVEMPRRWSGKGWRQVLDEPGLLFKSNLEIIDRKAVVDHELVVSAWSISADHADSYVRVVTKANQNLTKLLARVQLGRIAPALSLWQWLLINRWRRAVLVGVLYILFVIVNSALNRH